MRLFSKEQLIEKILEVFDQGWHRSVKKTIDTRNDGAVGNTFEILLGIRENNLPLPNAVEWELKGQRQDSVSLVTLKHIEPSPRAAKIVANILLPLYGWKHQQAGQKYPHNEMSFRSTTSATGFTSRGFKIEVDRDQNKLRFIFDHIRADRNNPEILSWLKSVEHRIGLGALNPEPYWGFEDLKFEIGSKIKNCFYIIAERKIESSTEYFLYKHLYLLTGFSFEKFLSCIEQGALLIDFDARTGHNHGTKFRIKQGFWKEIYKEVRQVR
jgi:hypothetical protein